MPSNISKPRLFGHALRLNRTRGLAIPPQSHFDVDTVHAGVDEADAHTAALIAEHLSLMNGSAWDDQDFGSGGPVYAAIADAVLASGKDGIL